MIKGTPILFFSSFGVRDLVDGAVFDFLRPGDFEDRVRDELGLVGGGDDGDDGDDGNTDEDDRRGSERRSLQLLRETEQRVRGLL